MTAYALQNIWQANVLTCLTGWVSMAGLIIYATAMDVARCVTA